MCTLNSPVDSSTPPPGRHVRRFTQNARPHSIEVLHHCSVPSNANDLFESRSIKTAPNCSSAAADQPDGGTSTAAAAGIETVIMWKVRVSLRVKIPIGFVGVLALDNKGKNVNEDDSGSLAVTVLDGGTSTTLSWAKRELHLYPKVFEVFFRASFPLPLPPQLQPQPDATAITKARVTLELTVEDPLALEKLYSHFSEQTNETGVATAEAMSYVIYRSCLSWFGDLVAGTGSQGHSEVKKLAKRKLQLSQVEPLVAELGEIGIGVARAVVNSIDIQVQGQGQGQGQGQYRRQSQEPRGENDEGEKEGDGDGVAATDDYGGTDADSDVDADDDAFGRAAAYVARTVRQQSTGMSGPLVPLAPEFGLGDGVAVIESVRVESDVEALGSGGGGGISTGEAVLQLYRRRGTSGSESGTAGDGDTIGIAFGRLGGDGVVRPLAMSLDEVDRMAVQLSVQLKLLRYVKRLIPMLTEIPADAVSETDTSVSDADDWWS